MSKLTYQELDATLTKTNEDYDRLCHAAYCTKAVLELCLCKLGEMAQEDDAKDADTLYLALDQAQSSLKAALAI